MFSDLNRTQRLIETFIALLLVMTSLTSSLALAPVFAQVSQSNYVVEYRVPTPDAAPLAITVDNKGDVWFTESNASKLGMFDPSNQTFREYNVPWIGDMWGIIVDGSGNVWCTLAQGGKSSVAPGGAVVPGGNGSIIRFASATENFTRIPIPGVSSFPLRLKEDSHGRIWFTELLGNKIGVYDPSINSLREYPIPTNMSGPADLTFDSQGNLWFTEAYATAVGEFNPLTHVFGEYPLGNNASEIIGSPVGIAIDAEGMVWVADHGGNWIVEYDPQTKTTTKFPTHFPPTDIYPISLVNDLVIDKQGRVWFTEHGGNSIAYYVPKSRSMVEFPIPTGPISATLWMALAPNGNVWFAEWSGNKIGTVQSNASAPIMISTSTNSIVVNQGDQFTIPLQVQSTQGFMGNANPLFALDSYDPTDVSGTFTPTNLTLSATAVPLQAQFTASKSVYPGNYTLAVGVQTGSVRVLTMVSVEVLLYNSPEFPILLTSEIVLVIMVIAVAIALLLKRLSRRHLTQM